MWLPAALFGLALPALHSSQPQAYPSPADTRAELQRHCAALTGGDNAYFGTAMVEQLGRRIAGVADDPPAAANLRGRLAYEMVRLGRFAEAIALLEQAQRIAAEAELGDSLRPRILAALAMAHLQLAEDENCVDRHTASSCILPITAEAVHQLSEHGRRAGDLYLEYLALRPDDLQVRWLLNLARMVTGDYPAGVPEPLRLPPGALDSAPLALWRNVAPELGVDAHDLSGGAAMEDFDGDGLLDLVSSSWAPCEPMKAFRNDGRGGFEDVSEAWGLTGQLGGLNLMTADYDNDGMVDILVLRGAWLGEEGRMRNSLLRNDLNRPAGRFVDATAAAGLAFPAFPTQAAGWADYDGDGDLDLFVGNEATATSTDPLSLFGKTGNPYPSQLFRNNGDGTFTDVARAAGVTNRRFTKSVAWGDYDDDGDPDLFLSNIGANRLYRNDGARGFIDVARQVGVEEPADGTFPSWFFDYDNDGDLDLLVASYSAPIRTVSASYLGAVKPGSASGHPVLYRNDGGAFADVSIEAGLWRPSLPMGSNYGDLDNDGWLDFYLGTGVPDFDALMPNIMYRNLGGLFVDVSFSGGFAHLQKGHGVAFGDLDNDGDQDLFQQLGGAFPFDAYGNALYENPGNDNRWITLELLGRRANRFGVGARIEVRVVEGGASRSIHLLAGTGGSFGASSLRQEIGLGRAERIGSVTVLWPGSGTRQVFTDVAVNACYRVTEDSDRLQRIERPRIRLSPGSTTRRHGESRR